MQPIIDRMNELNKRRKEINQEVYGKKAEINTRLSGLKGWDYVELSKHIQWRNDLSYIVKNKESLIKDSNNNIDSFKQLLLSLSMVQTTTALFNVDYATLNDLYYRVEMEVNIANIVMDSLTKRDRRIVEIFNEIEALRTESNSLKFAVNSQYGNVVEKEISAHVTMTDGKPQLTWNRKKSSKE